MRNLFIPLCLLIYGPTSFANLSTEDSITESKPADKLLELESEFSIVGTGGNSKFETYNLKSKGSLFILKNIISLSGHYTLGTAGDAVSARNWDIKFRYDRKLPYKMTGYISEQIEADEFTGVDQRNNLELGASKTFLESKESKFKMELAYRYSQEKQTTGNEIDESLLRLFFNYDYQLNKNVNTTMWVEYLPNMSDSENYLVSFGPSLLVRMSEKLSMKFGYTGRYDNVPAKSGNKKFDFTYSTSLIAKF